MSHVLVTKDPFIIEYLFQRMISTSGPRRATVLSAWSIWRLSLSTGTKHILNKIQWLAGIFHCYLLCIHQEVEQPTQLRQKGAHLICKGLQERHATATPQKPFPYLLESSWAPESCLLTSCYCFHCSGQKHTGHLPCQQAVFLLISRTAQGVLKISCLSSAAIIKNIWFQSTEEVKTNHPISDPYIHFTWWIWTNLLTMNIRRWKYNCHLISTGKIVYILRWDDFSLPMYFPWLFSSSSSFFNGKTLCLYNWYVEGITFGKWWTQFYYLFFPINTTFTFGLWQQFLLLECKTKKNP